MKNRKKKYRKGICKFYWKKKSRLKRLWNRDHNRKKYTLGQFLILRHWYRKWKRIKKKKYEFHILIDNARAVINCEFESVLVYVTSIDIVSIVQFTICLLRNVLKLLQFSSVFVLLFYFLFVVAALVHVILLFFDLQITKHRHQV